LEESSNRKGKLAEASEEDQGPRRVVEPMIMMMMMVIFSGFEICQSLNVKLPRQCVQMYSVETHTFLNN
jgi:hypothetical protein